MIFLVPVRLSFSLRLDCCLYYCLLFSSISCLSVSKYLACQPFQSNSNFQNNSRNHISKLSLINANHNKWKVVICLLFSYKLISLLVFVFLFVYASRGNVFYRISTYERRQAGLLPKLSNGILRPWYQKTTWKFIFFGLEKVLAVYQHKALMDLLFLPSVLPQVCSIVRNLLDPLQLALALIWSPKCTVVWQYWTSYTDFIPTVSNKPPSNKKNRTGLIVGIVVPVGVLSFLSLLVVFRIVTRRRKKSQTEDDEG